MDLERISKAFYLGYLWSLGRRFAMDRAMAMDAKRDMRDVRWITINGNHVPISKKTGEPIGRWKKRLKTNESLFGLKKPKTKHEKGSNAHKVAKEDMTKEMYKAARSYSADTERGHFNKVNAHYRKGSAWDKKAEEMARGLDFLFEEAKGLDKPIRLFRGTSLNQYRKIQDQGYYEDLGFSSASTSMERASEYSDDNCILIIDLPKGFKAVSLDGITRTKADKEILLPRGIKLEPTSYNRKGNFRVVYLKGK